MSERRIPDAFYRHAFDRSSIGMGLIGMHARWIAVNAALCRLLGYAEDELLRLSWRAITHPDDVGADMAQIARLLSGAIDSYSLRKRCVCKDGASVEMLVNATMSRGAAMEDSFFAIQLLDLPRTLAEEEERRHREKIRLLVENVSDGFIGMDQDGRVTEWNHQAERMLGWSAGEAIGQPMADMLVPPRLRARHEAGLRRFLLEGSATIINRPVELPVLRKDGSEIEAELTIAAARHLGRYHFATFVRDISARKELEQRLQREATHDHLTGLPNRFEFMRQVEAARAASSFPAAALLFVDLDGFKSVNDRHGHQAGDRVLQAFAAAAQACLPPDDVAARLAGDEFAVLVRGGGATPAALSKLAARLVSAARAAGGAEGLLGASIGIARHEAGVGADEWLRRADAAMYEAKKAGKARHAFARCA